MKENKKNMNMTKMIVCGLMAVPMLTGAMPSKTDLDKVSPVVADLMKPEQDALKAGKKTKSEVADAALELVKQADGEAAKLLLAKGAFNLYVRDGQFDKALDTLKVMRTEVPDITPQYLSNIIETALRRVSKKNGGQLYQILDETKTLARYQDELKKLEAQEKKRPADKALQTKLAEHHAVLGDWTKALEHFAKGEDAKAAQMAKDEQDGAKDAKAIADFWWTYPDKRGDEFEKPFKQHAAALYSQAVASGKLVGLNKVQAERRIEEAKELGTILFGDADTTDCLLPGFWFGAPAGNVSVLELSEGCNMEFVYCPAGSFTMGYEGTPKISVVRDVMISKPFWMTKRRVTKRQLLSMGIPTEKRDVSADIHDPTNIEKFEKALNEKYGKQLPKGYTFRLVTEAEYEYVSKVGAEKNDPRLSWGYAKPNANNPWGIEDLFRPDMRLVFQDRVSANTGKDVFAWSNAPGGTSMTRMIQIDYSRQPDKDPLMWSDEKGARYLRREVSECAEQEKFKLIAAKDGGLCGSMFYFVIAPNIDSLKKFLIK